MGIRIEKDDRRLLEHIARHRLTVRDALPWVLRKKCEDSGEVVKANATQIDNRIRKLYPDYIESSSLYPGGGKYYFLTSLGGKVIGADENRTGVVAPAYKAESYAILSFCCLQDKPRHLFTRDEFKKRFPALRPTKNGRERRRTEKMHYYLDKDDEVTRLSFIKVDCGQQSRWTRFVKRLADNLYNRRKIEGYDLLVQRGQFSFTVLTPIEHKAKQLSEFLESDERDDLGLPRTVPVRVYAIPELIQLLPTGAEVK